MSLAKSLVQPIVEVRWSTSLYVVNIHKSQSSPQQSSYIRKREYQGNPERSSVHSCHFIALHRRHFRNLLYLVNSITDGLMREKARMKVFVSACHLLLIKEVVTAAASFPLRVHIQIFALLLYCTLQGFWLIQQFATPVCIVMYGYLCELTKLEQRRKCYYI